MTGNDIKGMIALRDITNAAAANEIGISTSALSDIIKSEDIELEDTGMREVTKRALGLWKDFVEAEEATRVEAEASQKEVKTLVRLAPWNYCPHCGEALIA